MADFDKKPGSRDGKPNKTTRRKGDTHAKPADVIELKYGTDDTSLPNGFSSSQTSRGPADPETGLLPGISYSVNKGKRWELVADLKNKAAEDKANAGKSGSEGSDDDDEPKETRGHVMLVEVEEGASGSQAKASKELKNKLQATRIDAERHKAKQEKEAAKAEEGEQTEMIKSRKGPRPKKNQHKSKGKEDDEGSAYDPQRVYVVVHTPSAKGEGRLATRERFILNPHRAEVRCKKSLARDGSGVTAGCSCPGCSPRGMEVPRSTKEIQLFRDAGLK